MSAISVTPSEFWGGNDGQWSTFTIQVGSPTAQSCDVFVATGQALNYVVYDSPLACTDLAPLNTTIDSTDCHTERGNVWNINTSDTFEEIGFFAIPYIQDHMTAATAIKAEYAYDTVGIGYQGSGLPLLQHQLVGTYVDPTLWNGLLGILPRPVTLNSTIQNIPSFIEMLKNQSTIPSLSWGYTAGAKYRLNGVFGSLTLGGYDLGRFTPNEVNFPMSPNNEMYLEVGIQQININKNGDSTPVISTGITAALDSTEPYFWLPEAACQVFENAFKLTYDDTTGMYFVPNASYGALQSENPSIQFTLGPKTAGGDTVTINLPFESFDLIASPPLANYQHYFPLKRANESQNVLGRTFFQEAYVIANFELSNFSVNAVLWEQGATQQLVDIPEGGGAKILTTSTPTPTLIKGGGSGGGSSTPVGAIAGGVIGAILAILIIVGLVFFLRRKRRQREAHELPADDDRPAPPYTIHPTVNGMPMSEMDGKAKIPQNEMDASNAGTPSVGSPPNEMDANVYHELPSPLQRERAMQRNESRRQQESTSPLVSPATQDDNNNNNNNTNKNEEPEIEDDDSYTVASPSAPWSENGHADVSEERASGVMSPVSPRID